jgi:hypothetical protein
MTPPLADKLASQLARLVPFGKRSDDPLASFRAATQWLDQLPVGDAYKCQEAVLRQIKRLNEQVTPLTKEWLNLLMLLDERSRDLQDTLVNQYLRNPRMSRQQESQLWHAVYALFWETARGYHAAALRMARAPGRHGDANLMPRVVLRAIRAVGQLLKWRAIRYLPAGEKLWLRLHGLYQIAEDSGFQRATLQAYRDDPSEGSCESSYLHILMLQLAHSGSLYPRQIDLLDRWLLNWHGRMQFDAKCDRNTHQFTVDLAADHGPRRARVQNAVASARCWNTTGLLEQIGEIQAALQNRQSPAESGLGEHTRPAESLELLTHLQRQWAIQAAREQRRAPRETIKRLIDVAHGLSAIVNQIKTTNSASNNSPYGSTLSYRESDDLAVYGFVTDRTRGDTSLMKTPTHLFTADVERWVMHDESECGYGAFVELHDMDWLRVGTLLAVKPHDTTDWKIGIVRRLSRHSDDTLSVGIETLPHKPELAMLYSTATAGYTVNGLDNSGANLPHASVWLDGTDGPDTVIVDPVHYAPGKVFRLAGVPDSPFITLGSPLERSEGWMRVVAEPASA